MRAFIVIACLASIAFARAADDDPDLTTKLGLIIGEINLVHPGMTRGDLLKFFKTEGGLSTRRRRRYVERRCPYIKVDVQFRPVGQAADPSQESEADVITNISEPFLQRPVAD